MTEEELRQTIKDFKYYSEESKRLHESLGASETIDIFSMQIGSSKREVQIRRKLEKIDRKITMVLQSLEEADLTDKEWSIIDCVMDGMSFRKIALNFGCSKDLIRERFDAACVKLVNYLNAG